MRHWFYTKYLLINLDVAFLVRSIAPVTIHFLESKIQETIHFPGSKIQEIFHFQRTTPLHLTAAASQEQR